MPHTFAWLPASYRSTVLMILFTVTAFLAFALRVQGRPLVTDAAPHGIISYELAWSVDRAQDILESWEPLEGTARRQLYLDFGFVLVYPPLLALGCAMLAGSRFSGSAPVGAFLSWAILAAAPLDAIENLALLGMIAHGADRSRALIAAWCAGLKFVLAYAGLGYILLAGPGVLIGRMRALG